MEAEAEFLSRDENLYRNIVEDPIPLPISRYNLSNDPPEWPMFKSFDERERLIRRFLLHEYSLRLPSEPAREEEEFGGRYDDEVLANTPAVSAGFTSTADAAYEGITTHSSAVDESARVRFEKPPVTSANYGDELHPRRLSLTGKRPKFGLSEHDEAEVASDRHSGHEGTQMFSSSRPVGSLRGSRYIALQARALAEHPGDDDEEHSYEGSSRVDEEASTDSDRPVTVGSEEEPVPSEAMVDLEPLGFEEPYILDQVEEFSPEPTEPIASPRQHEGSFSRLIDTHGTESALVRARVVAHGYLDTERAPARQVGLAHSHPRFAYRPGGAAEKVQLHENIVRFAGDVDDWFTPARGDILITRPRTTIDSEDTVKPYTPWLDFHTETCPDEPSATDSSRSEHGSQAQHQSGCLRVWNGLYMHELNEFVESGDLLLRIGTWKPQQQLYNEDAVNRYGSWPSDHGHSYSPYYRVDLYSVRRLRPANKYIFLGYQHPLQLEGRDPSCMLHSPGQYLNPGAFCPSSFAPVIGDVIIRKEAFNMNFPFKEDFRRSMVKWYKTRTSISMRDGLVEQSTEIKLGTFLLRPYAGKVEESQLEGKKNVGKIKCGGAELYRYEKEGWVFWGRERLLVEFGSRLLTEIPLLYVADPGPEQDNPNFPSPLILSRS